MLHGLTFAAAALPSVCGRYCLAIALLCHLQALPVSRLGNGATSAMNGSDKTRPLRFVDDLRCDPSGSNNSNNL
jgi:hypothetical protein